MDALSLEFANGVGVVALCVVAVVALARGWVVTARELASVTRDRDEWRATAKEQAPLIEALAIGQEKQLLATETTNHLLRSLPSPAAEAS